MTKSNKSSESEPSPRVGPPRAAPVPGPVRDSRKHRPDVDEGFFGVVWPLSPGVEIPGLARRAAAFALDLVIALPLLAFSVAMTEILSGGALLRYDALVRSGVTFLLLLSVQFACWESSPSRATPGKIMLDMRVATATDAPLRFADALIRFWLRVATIGTGNVAFWVAWSDRRGRALHDRWCGTVVIAHDVTPGQLRTAARRPASRDLATALATSALAYLVVFETGPNIAHEMIVADRFEAAIIELTPVLINGELVDGSGRWTRPLRDASATVDELQLTMQVDGDGLVLRAPAANPVRLAGSGSSDAFEVRIERAGSGNGNTWSCTRSGLGFYAAPRHCTEISPDVANPELSLAEAPNPG